MPLSRVKRKQDRVVAAARSVSASTVHLITAATVLALTPNSQLSARLRAAGKAVSNATESLVKTASGSSSAEKGTIKIKNPHNLTSFKVAEMDAQAEIIAMERQLSEAREKLSGSP